MFKNTTRLFWGFTLVLTVFTFSFFIGCEKKEAPKETTETVKTPVETTPQPAAEQPKVEEKKVILDLKGTYSGTLDSRATTLKITEQTDTTFTGSITINYREVINQKISGKLDQEKMTATMKDVYTVVLPERIRQKFLKMAKSYPARLPKTLKKQNIHSV